MSSSESSETDVHEDGRGVELDNMEEELPVKRKHLNKLLHKVTGLATANKAYSEKVVELEGALVRQETRLDRIDPRGKRKAVRSGKEPEGEMDDVEETEPSSSVKGRSSKGKRKLQMTTTSQKQEVTKKDKKRSKVTAPTIPAVAETTAKPVTRNANKRTKLAEKDKTPEHSDDEKEEEEEGEKHRDSDDDQSSQENSVEEDDKAKEEVGEMPLPDLTASIEHTPQGRIICKNINGAGLFLRYEIPENQEYRFKESLVNSAFEAAMTQCGIVDYPAAVHMGLEWKVMASMVVTLLKSEYGKHEPPILLTKEVAVKFTEEEKKFGTVMDLQPMPISVAMRSSCDKMCTVKGKSLDLQVLIDCLPAIAKFVTGLRGGTCKISSPVKNVP